MFDAKTATNEQLFVAVRSSYDGVHGVSSLADEALDELERRVRSKLSGWQTPPPPDLPIADDIEMWKRIDARTDNGHRCVRCNRLECNGRC